MYRRRSASGDASTPDQLPIRTSGALRSVLAIMLAVLLSFVSVMGMGGTIAAAATLGISVDVNLGNEKFDGTSVVTENQQLTMMLQYDGT
ncbi:MAG: hypothetical protein ACREXR_23765, partial [Gammaproteobacteria bacterium]